MHRVHIQSYKLFVFKFGNLKIFNCSGDISFFLTTPTNVAIVC